MGILFLSPLPGPWDRFSPAFLPATLLRPSRWQHLAERGVQVGKTSATTGISIATTGISIAAIGFSVVALVWGFCGVGCLRGAENNLKSLLCIFRE